MDLGLDGKVALVAGGSRGIGAEIAKTLCVEGMKVVAVARKEADLSRLVSESGGQIHGISADLTSEKEIQRAIEGGLARFGRLDSLVCNVGSGKSVPWGDESESEWDRVLRVNLISTALTVRAAAPHLAAVQGSIVCISSICGIDALGAPVAYAAAKAGLNQFVVEGSRQLAPRGVRLNAVAPGNVFFPNGTWDEKKRRDPKTVMDYLRKEVPMNRFGTPSEIAATCAFLLSSRSSFTTGAILPVDGGQTR